MNRKQLAVIFIYKEKSNFTSIAYNKLIANAKDIDVFPINQYDFPNDYYPFLDINHISSWLGREIWYWGSDNIFLYWFLSNPNLRYDNYLILEDDTIVNQDIRDFFNLTDKKLSENHLSAVRTMYDIHGSEIYKWFDEERDSAFAKHINPNNIKDPDYTLQKLINKNWSGLTAAMPLCGTMIHNQCVLDIIEYIQNMPSANKIHVETKFATILKHINITHKVMPHVNPKIKMFNYIHFLTGNIVHTLKKNAHKGIFHPVKNMEQYFQYFDPSKNLKNNMQEIYFGRFYDVTNNVQLYIDNNMPFVVSNNIFQDPVHGYEKKLYLEYEKNGQLYNKVFTEGDKIEIHEL